MGADVPKQYLELAGATVLEHSLRALLECPRVQGICVALHAADTRAASLSLLSHPRVVTVTGAEQRSGSVLAGIEGLAGMAGADDWLLVHDAARPCVRADGVAALVDAVTASGVGGLLAEPVVDTVKRADEDGRVESTLQREGLWRAQTPQMFRLGELRDALLAAAASGAVVTDESSAMELAGQPVQLVPGPPSNLKVTQPDDLPLAEFFLRQAGR
jgi:2-C-methyl-D-erythritol 4-phosphate cytidylyltransferase